MSPATKPTAELRALSNTACIVGVDESDEIGTLPGKSQLTLHLEAITNAVRDAGLKVSDVDGIFTAGQHPPSLLGEALGVTPRYVDGTQIGGCSFIVHVEHAVAAIDHHLCDVALITHGESGASRVGMAARRDSSLTGQFEIPFGFGGAPDRLRDDRPRATCTSTAPRASSSPRWRCRRASGPQLNPRAHHARADHASTTCSPRADVAGRSTCSTAAWSPTPAAPSSLTRAERARDLPKKPVYVLGTGEATDARHGDPDARPHALATPRGCPGERAFAMAGVHHATSTSRCSTTPSPSCRRSCSRRSASASPARAARSFGPAAPRRAAPFPMNTNGGGLSYTHSGMYGIFPIIEAVAAAPRRVRRAPGPRRADLARPRHGRHALGRGHARARQRQVTREGS